MLAWLKRIFQAGSPENPSTNLSNPSEWMMDAWGGGLADSGLVVNKLTAMRASAVFRSVSILSGTIASMPWQVFRRTATGKGLAASHYAYGLLHDAPNEWMTSYTFRQFMVASLLLEGNFFGVIGWDRAGRAMEIIPYPADKVAVRLAGRKLIYTITLEDGSHLTFPGQDMIHVLGVSLDGIRGLSTIAAVAKQSIGLSLAYDQFSAKMHANSARPSGVVETEGGLSPEGFKRLKDSFDSLYNGTTNAGRTMYLDKGMKWTPMQISPVDAQTLESRRFQVADIARIFGLPPHLVGETEKSSSWGSGIEQMNIGFLQYTLSPWLTNIEQEFDRKLLGKGFFSELNTEGLLRGDHATRAEFYASGIQNGWMSPNEVRGFENMPPADGGDDLWIQTNLQRLDAPEATEPTGTNEEENGNADTQSGQSGE